LTAPAERSLVWLECQREQFDLTQFARDEFERVKLYKPLSELVLTASLLARDAALRDRCLALMDWAWSSVLGGGRYLLDLLSARPELVELIGLYARVYEYGFRNTGLDIWLGHLSGTALVRGLDLPAWRQTALQRALASLGLCGAPTEPTPGGWVAARPEPWTFTDTTGYPMTHEVFYLTDFGRDPGAVRGQIGRYLQFWAPAWSRCCLAAGNNDLAAELAMTNACMRAPVTTTALEDIVAWQLPDGSVRGPEGAGQNLTSTDADEQRRRFLRNYHTTLVTLLALTPDRWAVAGSRTRC
jgi:hypothetical protein